MSVTEKLRNNLNKIIYPDDVVPVTELGEYSDKEGFFPGYSGNFRIPNEKPRYKYLILGQDLNNREGFKKTTDEGNELKNRTFKNLEAIFKEAKIDLEECFLSNILMGIRNMEKNTGPSPGLKNREYVQSCLKFLEFQIKTIKPEVIITLGIIPIKLLTVFDQKLHSILNLSNSIQDTDLYTKGIISKFNFDKIPKLNLDIVFLTHPSYYAQNIRHRKKMDKTGREFEKYILDKIKKH